MTIRWFISKTVRQLAEMCRQMERVINEQRDLLSAEAVGALETARAEARGAIQSGAKKPELKRQMGKLEEAARKWFKPYASAGVRENVKEFLVAVVTILSFTTFFLQLTKIPTGSMQPTLFGITYQDLQEEKDFEMPPLWKRLALYWTKGISYKHLVAPFDGVVTEIKEPQPVFPFVRRQAVTFADPMDPSRRKILYIWFPPDDRLFANVAPVGNRIFRKGESIVKVKALAGDHLLVDRFTYNFRHPKRGEIFVFKTKGIVDLAQQDVLYIKRLVALPGEQVQIGNDRHLIIDGKRLDAATPRFEMVYSFDINPNQTNNPYKGHVNDFAARQMGYGGSLAPRMPDETVKYKVGPTHYLAMGDNTMNSLDSRAWGDVPRENIIGKCWFVYWPFTDRFGWGYR